MLARFFGTLGALVRHNREVECRSFHMFMGTQSETLTLNAGGGLSGMHNISQDVDIGTVRLNYRFGGPVVAKY
jgi:outer membrane immunogenic protein